MSDPVTVKAFRESLNNLIATSKLAPKARTHQVPVLISSICSYAYENGISTPDLASLLEVVTKPSHLDQSSVATLVKSLYPADTVSSHMVCITVNALGQGKQKCAPATQSLLLRWLILVFEVIEDPQILSQLYSVLFNLLDMMSIRANLCHLLAILTRRRHVKSFRIQMLMELSRNFGSEPALLGLLHVYKDYFPDILVGQSTTGRVARFEHPDIEWRDRLRAIQEANSAMNEMDNLHPSGFRVKRIGARRGRISVIPQVHTYHSEKSLTTLEEISGVNEFVEKLDKIELPSQMISALDDPLLQKFIGIRNLDLPKRRIDQWLTVFLEVQLENQTETGELSKELIEVLQKVLRYAQYTKALPTPLLPFLSDFLFRWDGVTQGDLILGLMSYSSLQSFQVLQASLLQKLEAILLSKNPPATSILLDFYTSLLRQWTARLLSLPPGLTLDETLQLTTSVDGLVTHCSLLLLSLLIESAQPPVSALSSVLSFLSTLAHLISYAPRNSVIRILTPPAPAIYLLAFLTPAVSTLSPLASLLATYKQAFEATVMQQSTLPPSGLHDGALVIAPYPREYVNAFNGFLMDICNLLWRSRAFNTTDTNALGCLLSPSVYALLRTHVEALSPPQSLQTLFSLSHHPALVGLSTASFTSLEDRIPRREKQGDTMDIDGQEDSRVRHAGPVTQRSLAALSLDGGARISWADYRLQVLRWLGDRGVEGIGELMFCTMKLLINAKSNANGAPAGAEDE